jgi:predicted nucleic acid-binding protein
MSCVDTDILIDFLNNKKEAVEKIDELRENNALSTTSINSFELLKGKAELSKNSKEDSIDILLNNLFIYGFDFEASKKAANMFKELKRNGNLIDFADMMIASICIANDETLLTRNIKHFERIPGLKIEKI